MDRMMAAGVIGFGLGSLISGAKLRTQAITDNRSAEFRVEEMVNALEVTGGILTAGVIVGGGNFLPAEGAAGTLGLGLGLILSTAAFVLIPLFVLGDTSTPQLVQCATISMLMGAILIGGGGILAYRNPRRD